LENLKDEEKHVIGSARVMGTEERKKQEDSKEITTTSKKS
jgi:hypothetical protein